MKLREMPDTVVHCPDKETYDRLMQIYEEAGWRWMGPGEKRPTVWEPLSGFNFDKGGEYIWIGQNFHRTPPYASTRVLSLDQFLHEQSILQPEDLKVGDYVEVVEEFSDVLTTFKKGKYRIKQIGDGVQLDLPYPVINEWVLRRDVSKLRKCEPPEEKPKGTDGWIVGVDSADRTGYVFPIARMVINQAVEQMRREEEFAKLGSISPSLSPLMDCCRSIVSKARDLALSSTERKYRKLGLKDEHGLTREGRDVFVDLLFEKYGKDLMDPVVKKLAKKDEDEE